MKWNIFNSKSKEKIPRQLPDYVLSKNYDCFSFFSSDFLLSDTPSELKSAFLLFLEKNQLNTYIKIYNPDYKEMSIDYKDYDLLTTKYSEEKDPKLYWMTESPDAYIFDHNGNWEIYINSVYNIAIMGYDKKLENSIREIFFDSKIRYVYRDKYHYFEIHDNFMFTDNGAFKKAFLKNY